MVSIIKEVTVLKNIREISIKNILGGCRSIVINQCSHVRHMKSCEDKNYKGPRNV